MIDTVIGAWGRQGHLLERGAGSANYKRDIYWIVGLDYEQSLSRPSLVRRAGTKKHWQAEDRSCRPQFLRGHFPLANVSSFLARRTKLGKRNCS